MQVSTRRLQRDLFRVLQNPQSKDKMQHFSMQLRSTLHRMNMTNASPLFANVRNSPLARSPQNSKRLQHFLNFVQKQESHTAATNATQKNKPFIAWLSENIPKGFEKFYKGGSSAAKNTKNLKKDANTSKKSTTGKSNSEKTGGSNSGSGGKPRLNQMPKGDDKFGLLLPLIVGLFLMESFFANGESSMSEITWQEFKNDFLSRGQVEKVVVINKSYAKVYLRDHHIDEHQKSFEEHGEFASANTPNYGDADQYDNKYNSQRAGNNSSSSRQPQKKKQSHYYFNVGSVDSLERQLENAQRDLGIQSKDFVPLQYSNEVNWGGELMKLAPSLLIIGFLVMSMRGMGGSGGRGGMGGMFQVGKSTAKKIKKEDINITFKDVAGVDEAKKEIMEFVEFLKNQKKFTNLGAKIPKGALLVGPPGTGKTMLAKATAGEASVPFYSISGSDFIEMFVGVGPSRVRDLFKEARANTPCIVFIDEIDAVARARGSGKFGGGNDERENTLNQLLVEMDGFASSEGVVVLAGTNRADVLDKAILRPGRFDRQITVDIPDIKGRRQIFKVYLANLNLDGDIMDFARRMAALTPGFAGAEIANICNEAAIVAARRDAEKISFKDFEEATDRVIGGLETNKIMSPEEKKTVAYHEAGHAVTGWFLENADPLLKVTIVPRGKGSLGYAQYLPREISLHSQEAIQDIMCMALGGRAAEFVSFDGRITTGASDDLRRVTQMAYSMVQLYGMNDRIGQLAFPKEDSGGFPTDRPYSEMTAQAMDEEVKKIVDAAYQRTISLLKDKSSALEALAEELLKNETINHGDIVRVLGPRPFIPHKSYKEYVEDSWVQPDQDDIESEQDADANDDDDAEDNADLDVEDIAVNKEKKDD